MYSKPNSLVKCPECGKWYEFVKMTVRNQQMCPTCLGKAEAEAAFHFGSCQNLRGL